MQLQRARAGALSHGLDHSQGGTGTAHGLDEGPSVTALEERGAKLRGQLAEARRLRHRVEVPQDVAFDELGEMSRFHMDRVKQPARRDRGREVLEQPRLAALHELWQCVALGRAVDVEDLRFAQGGAHFADVRKCEHRLDGRGRRVGRKLDDSRRRQIGWRGCRRGWWRSCIRFWLREQLVQQLRAPEVQHERMGED